MESTDNRFDIILIGSGMGALASASILAQVQKRRVLVLERHWKIGGFTHVFRRGKYEWDVGLHYVGEMDKGCIYRNVFDNITQGKVRWNKMPDEYDIFVYPDMTFRTRVGRERLKQDLVEQFGQERRAIEKYFEDIRRATHWFYRHCAVRSMPRSLAAASALLTRIGSSLALLTLNDYLNQNFRDLKLKAILASLWGAYGLPPSMSAFVIHAVVTNHYFGGGYYPIGGSKAIAESIIPIVENEGGQILVNHEVKEIIIEGGKAIGVKVAHRQGGSTTEKEYFGETIISDAGAYATYKHLVPRAISLPFRNECVAIPDGTSSVTLYLGLKDDPLNAGFRGENYWIYDSYDHEEIFSERNQLIDARVRACYVSFPSLKNPDAKSNTAEIIAFVDHHPFKRWADQPWRNRDREYESIKERISDALIDFTDSRIKGIKEMVDYKELSTPLSTKYMTGHRNGNIYGIPATPERYKLKWLGARTPIKNLYLTGADTTCHGIVGAMLAGAVTASIVMRSPLGILKAFRELKRIQ